MDLNPLATLDAVQPADLDTGPVVVLNLLKFKSAESIHPYLEYLRKVSAVCADSGIELIYAGALKEQIQGDIGDWDVVLLARYPSRRACYEMFRSQKYQELHPLAEEALARRVLWPSEPVMPYKTSTIDFEGGEWLALLNGA
ncbi:MAG: DUF1330 domain-containing protein [Gammaproteobacteria bacterium]|nr:DUF1330 domain-containing protein [Gammaproteobacteria bacterium]